MRTRAGRQMHRGERKGERLAEYGRKPHPDLLAQTKLSQASIYWYMRERTGICVNDRGVQFHRIRDFKQY